MTLVARINDLAAAIRDKFNALPRGIGLHCAGSPAANEVIGGQISPYAFTITTGNCVAKALTAATAITIITVKKNGTSVGTVTFGAGSTTGTFNFTDATVAVGDQITFHAPATPDTTLANIDIIVRK